MCCRLDDPVVARDFEPDEGLFVERGILEKLSNVGKIMNAGEV